MRLLCWRPVLGGEVRAWAVSAWMSAVISAEVRAGAGVAASARAGTAGMEAGELSVGTLSVVVARASGWEPGGSYPTSSEKTDLPLPGLWWIRAFFFTMKSIKALGCAVLQS